MTESARQ